MAIEGEIEDAKTITAVFRALHKLKKFPAYSPL
jgi:hypothetical protein